MNRLPIDDKTIIELYKSGYSQNDIVRDYDTSVTYTRSVLSSAGFNTRGYRALTPEAMKVIEVLVSAGIRYVDIESVCDISFHAIRDYVNRAECRSREKKMNLPKHSFSQAEEFLNLYRKGDSFCFLIENFPLKDCDILPAFQCISKNDISEHRKGLRSQIEKLRLKGLSNAGITRVLNISRSIVRNGVKEHS